MKSWSFILRRHYRVSRFGYRPASNSRNRYPLSCLSTPRSLARYSTQIRFWITPQGDVPDEKAASCADCCRLRGWRVCPGPEVGPRVARDQVREDGEESQGEEREESQGQEREEGQRHGQEGRR